MVEVIFCKDMYGNYVERYTRQFDSVDAFVKFMSSDSHRGIDIDVVKDDRYYSMGRDRDSLSKTYSEREARQHDFHSLRFWTYNHYSDYLWSVLQMKVDGVCWYFNYDGKYVVTNTFMNEVMSKFRNIFKTEMVFAD